MLYRLNAPRFAVRVWDEGGVVHDEADATLFEVTPAAAEVLRLLSLRPALDLPELAQQMFDGLPEPEDLAALEAALAQLQQVGFVRSVPA